MTEASLKSPPTPVGAGPARSPAPSTVANRPLMSLLVILENLRQSEVMTATLKR